MRAIAPAVVLLVSLTANLPADQEAGNTVHVVTSSYGRCYAKSVPTERYGDRGVTKVYRVGDEKDIEIASFDWFSQRIFLECNVSDDKSPVGLAVVRFGPWARGRRAQADHFAIGFYFKGQTVREYSTLDIAGSPDNVSASVSHYEVFEKVLGYRWVESNRYVFEAVAADGRLLAFDPATGRLIKPNVQ